MKREFSNAKVQTSTFTKTRNLSKLLLAVLLSVVLFGGAMFLLFANHSAPVSTALAANNLSTLPTALDTAPTFTYDSSAGTVTGIDQTINGYNFKDDIYYARTSTNQTIGDVTYPYVVTLTKYTPTTPTQVVVPSQMIIGGNIHQVVIDSENNNEVYPFFKNNSVVTNISIASVGTTKVLATNCRYMFYYCKVLTSLDLSNFDTSNVTSMGGMFFACSKLISLDLSSFDTSKVTGMGVMFFECSSLTSLDLSNFDTSKVTDMGGMFSSCTVLVEIFLPKAYSSFYDVSLPATFYLESDNSVIGQTLNSFSDYASTESTKSKIVKGNYIFEIIVQTEYGTISDGTKNSVERLAYMYSDSTTYAITDNTISFGTVTVTATPKENCTFSGFFDSVTATTPISESQSITANTTVYARFASSQQIAPQFSVSGSTLTGVDSAYTLPDGSTYNFTNDKYTFSIRNTVIGSSTTAKDYVFITRYASTTPTQVVIPSQITIDGINYQVVVDCSNNSGSFFANKSVVTSISFAGIGEIKVLATNCKYMFRDCSSLTSLDISNFDTSNVTGMGYMFTNCSSLTSLDLSSFDTSNVTSMGAMFSNCPNLTSLDVSNFDTSNVTNMYSMFSSCSKLTSLDISNFDTSNVTGMDYMFTNCSSLTSLDLSSFDTSNVTDMCEMFYKCSSLTSLDLSNFNTSNVTNMLSMFWKCSSLASLDLSNFDTENVTDMGAMFLGCTSLITLDLRSFETKNVTKMSSMFDGCSGLTSLDLSNFDTSNITDMSCMFENCKALTSLDLSNFDTSNVTSFDRMFSSCYKLTSLDLSNFDTSNITNMNNMFYRCSSLTSLDLSNFNTSSVTDVDSMFNDCSGLTSLDVSNFDTSNVTYMGFMFSGCSSLTSLDVSNFDTSNVTSMRHMFSGCSKFTSAGVNTAENIYDLNFGPNFDTSNVTNMSGMFEGCSSLTSLDVSSFDTSSVEEMSGMFYGCSSLTSAGVNTAEKTYALNFGPNFDTSNVEDMSNMFYNCSRLTGLDLSSFDTRNVYDMTQMFNRCTSLTSLTLGEYFDMSQVEYISMAFATGSTLDVLDLSKVTFNNNIATDYYNTFAILGINKEYFRSFAEANETDSGDTYANLIYPDGQEPNAEALADYIYDYVCYYCYDEELIDSAKAVLNTKIGKIILPASVNGLSIGLPASDYAVNSADEYSSPYLLGYEDLNTANGTSYVAGATIENKNYVPAEPETPAEPTSTGVETSLLFAVSGAVVVALFAVAVAHVGKKKRVVRK